MLKKSKKLKKKSVTMRTTSLVQNAIVIWIILREMLVGSCIAYRAMIKWRFQFAQLAAVR